MINTCRSSWQIQTVPQAKGYQKNINSSKLQLHHQSVCESFSPVPFPWTDVLLIAAPYRAEVRHQSLTRVMTFQAKNVLLSKATPFGLKAPDFKVLVETKAKKFLALDRPCFRLQSASLS